MKASSSEQGAVERRAMALRHALRNRLAAIRNAAFFLERKANKTGFMDGDPRVAQFFELIERELAAADELASNVTVQHLVEGLEDGEPPV